MATLQDVVDAVKAAEVEGQQALGLIRQLIDLISKLEAAQGDPAALQALVDEIVADKANIVAAEQAMQQALDSAPKPSA